MSDSYTMLTYSGCFLVCLWPRLIKAKDINIKDIYMSNIVTVKHLKIQLQLF